MGPRHARLRPDPARTRRPRLRTRRRAPGAPAAVKRWACWRGVKVVGVETGRIGGAESWCGVIAGECHRVKAAALR